jgi:hypothetical protein
MASNYSLSALSTSVFGDENVVLKVTAVILAGAAAALVTISDVIGPPK